jgi:PAS domain-containing protein
MLDHPTMAAILDSLKAPILFADTKHVTRYMNQAAIEHYDGGEDLLGKSLLECHNEKSQEIMIEILDLMVNEGLEEREISQEDGQRIFMRVVKDSTWTVLGYYERYEPIVMS